MICRAKTGSGKTLAFALPVAEKLMAAKAGEKRGKPFPRALVLAPTRELAKQARAAPCCALPCRAALCSLPVVSLAAQCSPWPAAAGPLFAGRVRLVRVPGMPGAQPQRRLPCPPKHSAQQCSSPLSLAGRACVQVEREFASCAPSLRLGCYYGGTPIGPQLRELRNGERSARLAVCRAGGSRGPVERSLRCSLRPATPAGQLGV